jgi:Calx-beta domain/Bacterial Ig domain
MPCSSVSTVRNGIFCAALVLLLSPGAQQMVQTQAASPPILLVVNTASPNPFGGYLAEVLRAEGLTSFATAQLSAVTASQLAATQLVVLAETPLSASQVTLFSDYVASGGRLVALRPDPQLAALLGLTPAGGSISNGYLGIDTASSTGQGFLSATLPFKGVADRYTASNATVLATLYTDRDTASPYPAVTRNGTAVAWTFDLARSVAYTRQGNPAFAGMERDGEPPIRTTDIFSEDIDLDRVHLPHADILMRLFSRTIQDLLADALPLPRLWYFPDAKRTLLVLTSDTHFDSSPHAPLISAVEARGGRLSMYVTRWVTPGTAAQLNAWRANGHEFGLHPYAYMDGVNLDTGYTTNASWFENAGFGTPSPTVRNHQVEWQHWVQAAQVAAAHGIRLDTSFYTWGPSVSYADTYPNGRHRQAHGYITGSGLPMRFVDSAGAIVPVYQQVTSLIDEQMLNVGSPSSENLTPEQALAVTRDLIDDSQAGGYSALVTQFHADYYPFGEVQPWVLGTMDYAQSQGIPMWTSEHWLRYTEARAATALGPPTWSSATRQLSFTVTIPAGADAQSVAVPAIYDGYLISSLTVSGSPVPFTTQTINGRSTAFFNVSPLGGAARPVAVIYDAAPNQPPTAAADTASTATNTAVTIPVLANDGDPEGHTLSVISVTQPAGGTAAITSGGTAVLFTPTTGQCGTTAFTYVVSDGHGGTATGTVTVTVGCPANAPPIANNDSATTPFNTAVTIPVLANDSDPNNNPLTVIGVGSAARGTPSIAQNGGEIIYTPTSGLCGPDSFSYTITDGNGGNATATVSVTVGCTGNGMHTTVADFTNCASTLTGTQVTNVSGGEVRLGGGFGDNYASGTLDPKWTAGTWAGGAYTPTIANGVLSLSGVGGAYVRSTNAMPVTSLEARVRFTAAAWEHVGWGSLDFSGDQYFLFSTFNQTARLFARSNLGGGESQTDLGPIPAGFHTYRVERVTIAGTQHIRYLIDGTLVAEHILSGAVPSLHVYQSYGSQSTTPTLDIDTIAISPPYVASGTFESCPIDGGAPVTWTTASWTATLPAGTTLAVRTRTSPDLTTWSAWSAPVANSGDAVTSPPARYAQYRLELATTDAALSPVIESVTLGTGGSSGEPPVVSIGNANVTEGDSGTIVASFPVTLSASSSLTVTVAYATANGTATSGSDYQSTSGTVTFTPGTTTQIVSVTVLGDTLDEANETFAVELSNPVNATIGDATGSATITDNDPVPSLAIGDVSVGEGNAVASFTVTLSAASGRTVTVNYATAAGTAASGADFTSATGTVTFAAGVTAQTVNVNIVDDTTDEPNEQFTVGLSGATNASFADKTGAATIVDNDNPASLTINDVSINEGNSGQSNVTFTVTLSPTSGHTVTVKYATASGTATAGTDFSARTGTLTFTPAELTRTFTVPVLGDTRDEPAETFTVTLSDAVNATIGDDIGVATIDDNDPTPSLRINDRSVTEPKSGSINVTFTVTLSAASGQTVTVNYTTVDGSATAASGDYTTKTGTLTFAPGTTSMTIPVTVFGNPPQEATESFTMTLSAPTNATINDGSGICTIVDKP